MPVVAVPLIGGGAYVIKEYSGFMKEFEEHVKDPKNEATFQRTSGLTLSTKREGNKCSWSYEGHESIESKTFTVGGKGINSGGGGTMGDAKAALNRLSGENMRRLANC